MDCLYLFLQCEPRFTFVRARVSGRHPTSKAKFDSTTLLADKPSMQGAPLLSRIIAVFQFSLEEAFDVSEELRLDAVDILPLP